MVQETSIKAYREIREEGRLGNMQLQVYRAIVENPNKTDRELSKLANMEVAHWTARRNELWHKGYIETPGKRECSITSRLAMVWRIKTIQEQPTLW